MLCIVLKHVLIKLVCFIDSACYLLDQDPPYNDIARDSRVFSPSQCQAMCQKNQKCYYFAVNERREGYNGCWLKTDATGSSVDSKISSVQISPVFGVIFGPKYCSNQGKKLNLYIRIFWGIWNKRNKVYVFDSLFSSTRIIVFSFQR